MRRTTFLSLLVAGCGPNPAFDEPTADSARGTSTTHVPIDPTTTTTTGSPDPATTTGGVLVPTTDASTTSTTSSTGTPDGATTGATEPTEEETIRYYADGHCEIPLWCHKPFNNPFMGEPQRTASQLCFRPDTLPPYRLTRVGYVIAATFGELGGSSFLEVFTRGPDGGPVPEPMLLQLPLGDGGVTGGPHALVLEDPPSIAAREFCVGLVGGYTGGDGAGLGVGVDPSALASERSWLNFSDGGICELPGWNDVSEIKTIPNGTWCVDVTVLGHPPP